MSDGPPLADQAPLPRGPARWLLRAAVAAFLAVLALVAYFPALDNPLLFDDKDIILNNGDLGWSRAPALVSRDYFVVSRESTYRPLSTLSYMAADALMGRNYRGWRMLGLANHTLNAFLLFLLLGSVGAGPLFSAAAAALFLLHPAHSEVINVISFNEDILMTSFLLAASLLLSRGRTRGVWLRDAGVAACYFLALLCKETALFFPAIVWVWAAAGAPLPRNTDKHRTVRLGGALLLAAGAFVLVRFVAMPSPASMDAPILSAREILDFIPTLLQMFADFLARFFWPSSLAPYHYFPVAHWSNPEVVAGIAAALVLAFAVAAGVRRRLFMPAVSAAWYLAGMAILGYLLVSGNRVFAFDRYLYFPAIGLIWFSLWAVRALAATVPVPHALRIRAGAGALVLTLAVFTALTLRRNAVWSSEITLWEDAVRTAPDNPFSLTALGAALDQSGDHSRALRCYESALRIMPDIPDLQGNYALAMVRQGKYEEAARHFREAIRLRPSSHLAHGHLGDLLAGQGRFLEAAECFRQALRNNGPVAPLRFKLGNALLMQGQLDDAEREYRETLRSRPGDLDALNNLGIVADRRGRYREALARFAEALALDPGYAPTHHNIGATLVNMNDLPRARVEFRKALGLRPDFRPSQEMLEKIGP